MLMTAAQFIMSGENLAAAMPRDEAHTFAADIYGTDYPVVPEWRLQAYARWWLIETHNKRADCADAMREMRDKVRRIGGSLTDKAMQDFLRACLTNMRPQVPAMTIPALERAVRSMRGMLAHTRGQCQHDLPCGLQDARAHARHELAMDLMVAEAALRLLKQNVVVRTPVSA